MEKEMAIHSSILAWEIRWTEEPGGLQSMGMQKSQTLRLSNQTTTASLNLKKKLYKLGLYLIKVKEDFYKNWGTYCLSKFIFLIKKNIFGCAGSSLLCRGFL